MVAGGKEITAKGIMTEFMSVDTEHFAFYKDRGVVSHNVKYSYINFKINCFCGLWRTKYIAWA